MDKDGKAITLGKAKQRDDFQAMIDRMYKTVKTHCNIIDVDFKICAELS